MSIRQPKKLRSHDFVEVPNYVPPATVTLNYHILLVVLEIVGQEYYAADDDGWYLCWLRMILSVGASCRLWREALLRQPRMWTRIAIYPVRSSEFLSWQLQRLRVSASTISVAVDIWALPVWRRTAAVQDEDRVQYHHLTNLLRTFTEDYAEIFSRVQRIRIVGNQSDWSTLARIAPSITLPVACTTLVARCTRNGPAPRLRFSSPVNPKSLISLSLQHVILEDSANSDDVRRSQMQTQTQCIEIGSTSSGLSVCTWRELLENSAPVLRQLRLKSWPVEPRLRSMETGQIDQKQYLPPLTFNNLNLLTIDHVLLREIQELALFLVAPQLDTLELNNISASNMAENPFEPLRQIARAAGGSLKRLKLHSSQPWITSVEQSLPQILEHLPALAHFTLVIPSNAMTRCYERQLCLSVIMRDTSLCPMLIELELQWYDMEGSNRVKSTSDGSSLPSIMSHRVRPAASTPSFAKRRVPPLRSNSTSASWEPFSAPPTVDPPESSDGLQPPSPTSLLPHPSAYNMEMSFIREAVLSDEDLRSQGSVTNSSLRSSRLLSASVFNSNSENTDSTTTLLGLNEILESAKAHRPFMRVSIHEIERRIEWWREWDNHERW